MHKRRSNPLLAVAFLLSGAAGLSYEIVWTRMFAVGLGHEVPSMLAVVAAFFGGLALGAWGLDRRVSRSATPGRWYVLFEVVIGLWAIASTRLIPLANDWATTLLGIDPSPGRHWTVAFAVPFVILLPATASMGATMPAMERLASRLSGRRIVGGLYAANTLGAMFGVLASTHWLIPAVGLSKSIAALAAVNLICGALVLLGPAIGEITRPEVTLPTADTPASLRLMATLMLTGLFGVGYEILAVRVMAQVLENTVYSLASALAMYLLGSAIGATIYQAFAPPGRFRAVLTYLLQGIAFTCLLGVIALWHADDIGRSVQTALGHGFAAGIAAEMCIAALALLGPAMCMGATFSHLAQAARQTAGGVGKALGLNTIGGAIAPLLFGVILLPAAGAQLAIVGVSLAYLLLIPALNAKRLAPALACVALLPALPSSLQLIQPHHGGVVLEYREGVMAAVAVVTDSQKHRYLKVNNQFQEGGTQAVFPQRRQAHIPLLLHGEPKRALFLGLGAGMTLGTADDYPGLVADGVELLPEVVACLPHFGGQAGNRDPLTHPRMQVHVADARRFVRANPQRYDVIIADLYQPARDGAGSLYTREHFRAIADRMADDGLFCQWIPTYQMDFDTLRVIMRTFLEVFPEATAWIVSFNAETPAIGLIGKASSGKYPVDWFDQRVRDPKLAAELDYLLMGNTFDFFGCFVAGASQLAAIAGDAPINTDDHPIVTFQAPHYAYDVRPPLYQNIDRLIDACPTHAADVMATDHDPATGSGDTLQRLDDYAAARNLYLKGTFLRLDGHEDAAINRFIEATAASRDFKPGDSMVQFLAQQRAMTDPASSRRITAALHQARQAAQANASRSSGATPARKISTPTHRRSSGR